MGLGRQPTTCPMAMPSGGPIGSRSNGGSCPRHGRRAGHGAGPPTGTRYELRSRIVDLDPLEQRLTLQMRAVLWRAGQRVAEEEHSLQENLYFLNEVLLLLAAAGFGEITVQGGYTAVRCRIAR